MRIYANTAVQTTLIGDITDSSDSITLGSATGWPTPDLEESALAAVRYGTAEVEVIEFTGRSGAVLTGVTRGVDGTTARSHAGGAIIVHMASATDLTKIHETAVLYQLHAGEQTAAHGAISAATANRIPIRNAGGTFSVGAPTAASHPARLTDMEAGDTVALNAAKAYTDGLFGNFITSTEVKRIYWTDHVPPPEPPNDGKMYLWLNLPEVV
jgi:hypothetical protein